jgi:hypothetical protein
MSAWSGAGAEPFSPGAVAAPGPNRPSTSEFIAVPSPPGALPDVPISLPVAAAPLAASATF